VTSGALRDARRMLPINTADLSFVRIARVRMLAYVTRAGVLCCSCAPVLENTSAFLMQHKGVEYTGSILIWFDRSDCISGLE
jgi:hypothetical protein